MTEKMTVCLYEKVKEMAAAADSLYRDIGKDHDELLAFLDVNSWFGMHRNGSGDELYVSGFEQAETALMIWLKFFRQPQLFPKKDSTLLRSSSVRQFSKNLFAKSEF